MESNEEVIARLDALEQRGPRSNSKIGRLRPMLDRIERLFNQGFTQTEVLEELNAAGFGMTLAGFKSTLQRLRKERVNESPRSMAEVFRRSRQAGGDCSEAKK